jgi:lipopolysaccharide/colanic/teichoic acid biosynthesis glycosyltransferase
MKKRYYISFSISQDILLSLIASLVSVLVIRWTSEPIPGFTTLVFKWLAAAAVGTISGILISECSRDVKKYATVRSIARVMTAILIKEAVLVITLAVGLVSFPQMLQYVLIMLLDLILTGGALSYLRVASRLLSGHSPNPSQMASRKTALVAGTDEAAQNLAQELEKEGYDVIGLLSRSPQMNGRVIRDYVVYACKTDDDLEKLQWRFGGVDGVFFPRTVMERQDSARDSGDKGEVQDSVQQRDRMSLLGHMVKRSFDIGLSGFLLLIFSPVIAVCALLIKREDGGPVLFVQERIGRGGKPFRIYKFRSMRTDAEASGTPALYSGMEDPRLTRVGRFLRAHHLDELPQLWNVLKGDMSFIGYRPERQFFIDQIKRYNPRYDYLFQIRPGVTSYATLYNGYTDTMDKMLTRLDLDLYYLRNHTVWFDIKVLGLTFLSIVTGKKF